MAHILDLSNCAESLFQLRHVICGSREYCRRLQLHFGDDDYTPDDWESYQGQLHFVVSRSLLGVALSLRVLQDTLRSQSNTRDLAEAEAEFGLTKVLLGRVMEGAFALTLRESCNKIIHAAKVDLLFAQSRTGKPAKFYTYWNGHVRIEGEHVKSRWSVVLDAFSWCDAIDTYMECVSGDVEWR